MFKRKDKMEQPEVKPEETVVENTTQATAEPTNSTDSANPVDQNTDPAVAELQKQIEDLTAKNTEYLNDLQRMRADFENYRKNVETQKEQAKTLGVESTILKVLPIIDDMNRAFAANSEALAPVKKSFDKTMTSLNLQKIDSSEGVDFNPDYHNAISMDDSEGEKEVIAEELMPGYLYEGNVIRAAMVRVKKI